MDNGPFRIPQPTERNDDNKPEPTRQESEEVKPVVERVTERPQPVHRPTTMRPSLGGDEKSWKRFVLPAVIAAAVIILVTVGWLAVSGTKNSGLPIDSNKYQAVFFTNGQVYFGKLQLVNSEYMKLTDIFYLQTQSTEATDTKNPQQTSSQGNPTLIKLGDELHGPEDAMIISKDQVLFYENLKNDGKVAKSIEKYKKPN